MIEIPNVKWSDVGGLEGVKESLKEAVEWPIKQPEAFTRIGIKPPSGILLYGPPGTGKTLLAKAVATESGVNFIAVKGPEILTMWVGESEKKIREIFRKAKQVSPAIIFFDEIDSLTPKRGMDIGSRAMENIVSQILVEMSGLEEMHNVVVIAATNRPDMIDPALLRPGRFDRVILVPAPDEKARLEILKLYTKWMPLSNKTYCKSCKKEVSPLIEEKSSGEKSKIEKWVEGQKKFDRDSDETENHNETIKKCPECKSTNLDLKDYVDIKDLAQKLDGYTGADIEALTREAGLTALREDMNAKIVTGKHFEEALEKIKPSVDPKIIEYYKGAEERFRKAKTEKREEMDYVG